MNMNHFSRSLARAVVVALATAWLGAGCSTTPKKAKEAVFFPPAPDQPRIQYLTSFSSEGEYAGKRGFTDFVLGSGQTVRPIWKPYGMTTLPGMFYVCDTGPKNVGMLDLTARRLRYLRPDGPGALKMPINVAVDQAGNKYVTDTVRPAVMIYGNDNTFVGTLEAKAAMKPCGIAIANDRIYVTDLANHCVRVFNLTDRQEISTFPQGDVTETNRLFQPTNVAVDKAGRVYVSDSGGFAVHVFGPDGQHLRRIGEQGLSPGQFALPKGIGVDREGRIYVVDGATGLVQLFNDQGELLMFFAGPDSPVGSACYLPAGLLVDYENVRFFQSFVAPGKQIEYLIFVANQAGNSKISVYGFLKQ